MLWYTIEILSQKDVIRLVMNVCSSEQKMEKILCITRASIGKSGADIHYECKHANIHISDKNVRWDSELQRL